MRGLSFPGAEGDDALDYRCLDLLIDQTQNTPTGQSRLEIFLRVSSEPAWRGVPAADPDPALNLDQCPGWEMRKVGPPFPRWVEPELVLKIRTIRIPPKKNEALFQTGWHFLQRRVSMAVASEVLAADNQSTVYFPPMSEREFTHEELKQRVIDGWNDHPHTPGLAYASREVIAPHIEGMQGREIVYCCRWPLILEVTELQIDAEGFSAVAEIQRVIPLDNRDLRFDSPFRFGATWAGVNMCGSAVSMKMIVDCFITDPRIVRHVTEAADHPDAAKRVNEILRQAMERS